MKKTISLLVILLSLCSVTLQAQNKFTVLNAGVLKGNNIETVTPTQLKNINNSQQHIQISMKTSENGLLEIAGEKYILELVESRPITNGEFNIYYKASKNTLKRETFVMVNFPFLPIEDNQEAKIFIISEGLLPMIFHIWFD